MYAYGVFDNPCVKKLKLTGTGARECNERSMIYDFRVPALLETGTPWGRAPSQ